MKTIQFIIYGIWYTVTALWPLIKKFYEDMVVAAAVITAELEAVRRSGNFNQKSRVMGTRSLAKKSIAKDILRKSVLSPVTNQADEVIGSLVETGWDMLFNKRR
jgi:hypothetical protein